MSRYARANSLADMSKARLAVAAVLFIGFPTLVLAVPQIENNGNLDSSDAKWSLFARNGLILSAVQDADTKMQKMQDNKPAHNTVPGRQLAYYLPLAAPSRASARPAPRVSHSPCRGRSFLCADCRAGVWRAAALTLPQL